MRNMPKVTVSLGSSRPGGVDISFRGLADQTFKDFEVIFTDARYFQRHAQVLECAKKIGLKQPLYHVPNHRYNGFWGTACAGINTGFMLAAGEIVIILLDYAYTPPGWIEAHLKYHDKPRMVMAPHLYSEMAPVKFSLPKPTGIGSDIPLIQGVNTMTAEPMRFPHGAPQTTVENILRQKERFDEISIFEKPFESPYNFKVCADNDPKANLPTGRSGLSYNYMHTKNDSFPLKTVLDIGGMDENWDRGRGPGDTEFGYRLMMAGLEPWICHEALVYCPNPREIMPNLNTTIPIKWTPDKLNIYDRWSYEQGTAYFECLKPQIVAGKLKAPNPYDMHEKRKELWKWRKLSQEKEAVIPLNNISNKEYFGV